MKKQYILSGAIIAILSLASCSGGGDKTTKFAPKERESSMTDAERKAAIEAKKASLNVDINSMMNSNGIKLSVLPPSPKADITEAISERIGVKMLGIIAANGIGGVNNVPGFALAASMNETGRQTTGSAPQKSIIKYDISYQVMNVADGTVYASQTESVTGVGNSFQEAASNAVNEIKSTDGLQKMLSTASEKILSWYKDNLPTLKSQINQAASEGNYALALAYINSVPSQAQEAYSYAMSVQPEMLKKFKSQTSAAEFTALKSAIASGQQDNKLTPEVYNHLAMIPSDTPEYAQAEKLVATYEKEVLARQAASEAREIASAEAARIHEEQMQMAQLEANKTIAVAQAKASEQAMRQHMRDKDDSKRGFWGNLGARIISGIDYLSDKANDN